MKANDLTTIPLLMDGSDGSLWALSMAEQHDAWTRSLSQPDSDFARRQLVRVSDLLQWVKLQNNEQAIEQ